MEHIPNLGIANYIVKIIYCLKEISLSDTIFVIESDFTWLCNENEFRSCWYLCYMEYGPATRIPIDSVCWFDFNLYVEV